MAGFRRARELIETDFWPVKFKMSYRAGVVLSMAVDLPATGGWPVDGSHLGPLTRRRSIRPAPCGVKGATRRCAMTIGHP